MLTKKKGYIRCLRLEIEDVIVLVGKQPQVFQTEIGPVEVRVNTRPLRFMLKQHPTLGCKCCGLKSSHFWIERSGRFGWHFNLYGTNYNGHERMLTLDHIVPKSLGGTVDDSNLQILCDRCNRAKGSRTITLENLRQEITARGCDVY